VGQLKRKKKNMAKNTGQEKKPQERNKAVPRKQDNDKQHGLPTEKADHSAADNEPDHITVGATAVQTRTSHRDDVDEDEGRELKINKEDEEVEQCGLEDEHSDNDTMYGTEHHPITSPATSINTEDNLKLSTARPRSLRSSTKTDFDIIEDSTPNTTAKRCRVSIEDESEMELEMQEEEEKTITSTGDGSRDDDAIYGFDFHPTPVTHQSPTADTTNWNDQKYFDGSPRADGNLMASPVFHGTRICTVAEIHVTPLKLRMGEDGLQDYVPPEREDMNDEVASSAGENDDQWTDEEGHCTSDDDNEEESLSHTDSDTERATNRGKDVDMEEECNEADTNAEADRTAMGKRPKLDVSSELEEERLKKADVAQQKQRSKARCNEKTKRTGDVDHEDDHQDVTNKMHTAVDTEKQHLNNPTMEAKKSMNTGTQDDSEAKKNKDDNPVKQRGSDAKRQGTKNQAEPRANNMKTQIRRSALMKPRSPRQPSIAESLGRSKASSGSKTTGPADGVDDRRLTRSMSNQSRKSDPQRGVNKRLSLPALHAGVRKGVGKIGVGAGRGGGGRGGGEKGGREGFGKKR
jgi:hypothetical protein